MLVYSRQSQLSKLDSEKSLECFFKSRFQLILFQFLLWFGCCILVHLLRDSIPTFVSWFIHLSVFRSVHLLIRPSISHTYSFVTKYLPLSVGRSICLFFGPLLCLSIRLFAKHFFPLIGPIALSPPEYPCYLYHCPRSPARNSGGRKSDSENSLICSGNWMNNKAEYTALQSGKVGQRQ